MTHVWAPDPGAQALAQARVLFVNMPLRESAPPVNIPLGPALMAARLREHGAAVAIADLNVHRPYLGSDAEVCAALWDEVGRHLHGLEPHAVLLSGKITTLRWQARVARLARRLWPDAFLVSGGGLATELHAHLPHWVPELDACAYHDGDEVVLEIVRDAVLRSQGALRSHPDLYRGRQPPDLDALPFPAWDLCDLETYLPAPIWGSAAGNSSATPFTMTRSLNTVSTRGCPHGCRFCFTSTFNRRWGVRSAANVAAEARLAVDRYGIDFLGMTDDNAFVDPRRVADFADAFADLAASGLRMGTHCRFDEAADWERLAHFRTAGGVYIGVGGESAHPDTLTAMGKGGKILSGGMESVGGHEYPRCYLDTLRNCRELGVHCNSTWIAGYPGETLDALKTTVRFALLMSDYLGTANRSMFIATAYVGTEMWRDPGVQRELRRAFGDLTDQDRLRWYVESLDDATVLMRGPDGRLLNYSAMPDATLERVKKLVEADQIEEVLRL